MLIDKARAHPGVTAALLTTGLVVAVVGAWLFQPWLLFVDAEVNEDFPAASAASPVPADAAPVPSATQPAADGTDDGGDTGSMAAGEPVLLRSGTFIDRSHATSGTVGIYQLDDGSRILRIEDLQTDNGPDLFVYLTAAGAQDGSGEVDEVFVNLGRLKGNQGNQNYEIAADVDLDDFASIAIWCDRFDVLFGAADLT